MHSTEACREWARTVGATKPDVEYLLHDSDTWWKNPYYSGEPGPHPEDDQ